jgi:hypothetical protein
MYRRKTAGRSRLRVSKLTLACLSAVACSGALASPALAEVTEVNGGAFGESVNVTPPIVGGAVTSGPLPSVTLPTTGAQPPITQSVASVNVPNLLSTGILNVSTTGGNLGTHQGFATSTASVANVNALTGRVTAAAVASTCTANGDGASGSSTLTTASVLGLPVAVNPAPNTVIALPTIGSVTLNEQVRPTNGAGDTSIIVRAIHIRLNGTLGNGDIIIAESRCGARGPDVVPVAPIGLLGVTAMLGLGFAGMQWKKRRHNTSVAASTH